jgi:signal transduction histidine kinase
LINLAAKGDLPLSEAESGFVTDGSTDTLVPLANGGTLRGLLLLGDREVDYLLDEEDLDILRTVGFQAAVAGANATMRGDLEAAAASAERHAAIAQEANRRRMETRERERAELASELHNGPLQRLGGVLLAAGALRRRRGATANREMENAIYEGVQAAATELRVACRTMRPAYLGDGLVPALESYVGAVQQSRSDTDIQFRVAGLVHLPEDRAHRLHEICRAAVENAVRHARPSRIEVTLARQEHDVVLRVHDDGCGFEVPDPLGRFSLDSHFGLADMELHAGAVGGCCEVVSRPGEGTTITVMIPVEEDNLGA